MASRQWGGRTAVMASARRRVMSQGVAGGMPLGARWGVAGRQEESAASSRRALMPRLRALTTSRTTLLAKKAGGHDLTEHHEEDGQVMIGPGAAAGTVPTDEDQSTGLERFELLHKLQGEEAFYNDPVEITHFGTMQKPIMIKSLFSTRLVGCTGIGDAHETIWLNIHKDHNGRCNECGMVYKLDFVGDEHAEEHH